MTQSTTTAFLPGPGQPGLVTVVIPTYNRARLIGPAIESVLKQTYGNVEVIVVDDGSTDGTREIVEAYGPPVRYLYQKNAGAAAARNTGLRNARGEYVALLDSDDEWFAWKLEAQVRLLEHHPEVGMVWTDMRGITMEDEVISERYLRIFYDAHSLARIEDVCERPGCMADYWADAPSDVAGAQILKGDIFSQMLLGNLVHTSTVLLRRDRLRETGEIDIAFTPRGEDYEFHVRICSHGPVALLDAPSMLYRVGAPDQLTAPHMQIHAARSNLATVKQWLERGGSRITLPPRMVRQRIGRAYGWVGEQELEWGEWSAARKNLWDGLRHHPGQKRAIMLFLFTLMPAFAFHRLRQVKRTVRRIRLSLRDAMRRPALNASVAPSHQ